MNVSQKTWAVLSGALSQALTERDKALDLLHDIDVHLGHHGWKPVLPATDELHNRLHAVLLENGGMDRWEMLKQWLKSPEGLRVPRREMQSYKNAFKVVLWKMEELNETH